MAMNELPALHVMDVVGPVFVALVYIFACSFLREPSRRNFNAIMIAGAGAAYLNGGFGIWEFAFTTVVTFCAYKGLHSYYPSLTDLDEGDLKHSVDFRSAYASVLQDWFNIESKAILHQGFNTYPIVS